ncbi:hypothetical protein V8G56_00760 [Gaetbulibacter aquiaggeris]|uniref:Signal peptidase n=1 Tax=Gaetbulibacter aquiaggeris TaxID=1735373 RepID=A0ABW7MKS8_9FLAO
MKIQNKRLFASILFVLISVLCVAQGPPYPGGGPPGPPGFPIDGGILMGVGVALFYGVKKILGNK